MIFVLQSNFFFIDLYFCVHFLTSPQFYLKFSIFTDPSWIFEYISQINNEYLYLASTNKLKLISRFQVFKNSLTSETYFNHSKVYLFPGSSRFKINNSCIRKAKRLPLQGRRKDKTFPWRCVYWGQLIIKQKSMCPER